MSHCFQRRPRHGGDSFKVTDGGPDLNPRILVDDGRDEGGRVTIDMD